VSRALVVRGGWEGHFPVEATDRFLPLLLRHGEVTVADTLEAYTDPRLPSYDLIVQCWSMGALTEAQERGLTTAVRGGTGFAGWHGGVLATMYTNLDYGFMVGGRFVAHPGDVIDYRVDVTGDHKVVAGLSSFDVRSEQYFCHTDPFIDVHATTTVSGQHGTPEIAGAVAPVVWTRRYGSGRVFVSTLGHTPADFDVPQTRTITERGLLWATRGSR